MPLTLHGNFCQIFSLQLNIFTVFLLLNSQLSHRQFSPVQFDCVLLAVQCVLCALDEKKKKKVCNFCSLA